MSNFTTLAIMAESNHGKDFCGRWIVEKQGFAEIAFADHIKRLCNSVMEFGYSSLWGDAKLRNVFTKIDWDRAEHRLTWFIDDWLFQLVNLRPEEKANYKQMVKAWFSSIRLKSLASENTGFISPRIALQLIGTEYGRAFRQDIWSSLILNHIIPDIKAGRGYARHIGTVNQAQTGSMKVGAVITDCRFSSELAAVQAAGGYVIKVIRNSEVGKANEALEAGVADHSSELELRDIPDEAFDLILAMDDGADNVYPRLQKMFDDREFEKNRLSGRPLWKP